jgi:Ner family transcriptional regulator
MRGSTIAALSRAHGQDQTTIRKALERGHPLRWLRVVAEFIGVPPHEIWPSKFGPDGKPLEGAQ